MKNDMEHISDGGRRGNKRRGSLSGHLYMEEEKCNWRFFLFMAHIFGVLVGICAVLLIPFAAPYHNGKLFHFILLAYFGVGLVNLLWKE